MGQCLRKEQRISNKYKSNKALNQKRRFPPSIVHKNQPATFTNTSTSEELLSLSPKPLKKDFSASHEESNVEDNNDSDIISSNHTTESAEYSMRASGGTTKSLEKISEQNFEDTDDSPHEPQNDSLTLLTDSPVAERRKNSPMKMKMFNSPKALTGPRVLFKSPLPKHLAFRREKNNSTSSLYIKDTINSPNVDEIIRCMSIALLYHIKNGWNQLDPKLDHIFSEKYRPLTREYIDLNCLPDVSTIYRFINLIFRVQRLPPETTILGLAYIERILSNNKIVLHPDNWRRLVFGSIMMATKVWEDESVWNVDFLDLFPCLTLVDLNNLENRFVELLEFNVTISGSEYAKYYFELRALSQLDSFPLQPLNRDEQYQLEVRSQRTNEKVSKVNTSSYLKTTPKRAKSVDYFDPKSPLYICS